MKHSLFPLGLFFLWLLSYIIYPLWYVPQANLRPWICGALLIFFTVNFLLIDRFLSRLKPENITREYAYFKSEKIIWICSIIYILLELYPMTMPVLSRNDEEHYLTSSLIYYLKVSELWRQWLRFPFSYAVWLFLSIAVFIIIKRKFLADFLKKIRSILLLLAGGVLYYFLFTNCVSLDSFFYLFHYPLFSKFFYIIAYGIFGVKESGPRFVQAVFGVLSAIYLYKFVCLYRSKQIALFSFIIWLFMPACLFFGNLALMVNGISFFFISSFYYLVKFGKDKSPRSIFPGIFIMAMGLMYQQPVVAAVFIYYLYLFILWILKKFSVSDNKAVFILPGWVAMVTALPYLIITRFIYVPFGGYTLVPQELFSRAAYLEQVKLTFSGLSLIHILFLIIGVMAVIKKRDAFSLFTFIWLAGYFLFQIAYPYAGVFRLLVPYFPVLAIWIAEGLGLVATDKTGKYSLAIIMAYAILASTVWITAPVSPGLMLYHDIDSRYLPYPEAILYLKHNLLSGEKCLSPGHSSPEKFYCLKFGISPYHIDHTIWEEVKEQTADNLYNYAKAHHIKFCLFPSGTWPWGFLNFTLRDTLVSGMDKRFILNKLFVSGKNKLYLLEIR